MIKKLRLVNLLAGHRPDHTPVVPFIGAAAARMARVSTEEAFLNPIIQASALADVYELLCPDAIFPFMDLTVEPEALGAEIHWREGVGPEITVPLTPDQFTQALDFVTTDAGRLSVFFETVTLLSQQLGQHTVIGAYVPGPWTLVASTLGLAQAARLVRRDPSLAENLINRTTGYCRALMGRYAAAGATLIMILEPCIAGGILGPDDCARVLSQIEHMTGSAQALGVPVVLHVCGDANQIISQLVKVNCNGLSLDAQVDLASVARLLPGRLSLWGNISPVETLLQGNPQSVMAACHDCLGRLPVHSSHVLSTGCEVPLETPLENILAMCRSVESYDC